MSLFTINSTNGVVQVGDLVLHPNAGREALLSINLETKGQVIVNNPPWRTVRIRATSAVVCSLLFGNEQLKEVRLYILEAPPNGWKNWTSAAQTKAQQRNDEILRSLFGKPPYMFIWGEVESVHDIRSGASEIIIRYF